MELDAVVVIPARNEERLIRRTLEALAFSQIAATIPSLQAVVPQSLLALRQTRWCSNGTLQEGNAAALNGRAIHEVVVFR